MDKAHNFEHLLEIYMYGMNENGLKDALRLALGREEDNAFLLKHIQEWGVQHTKGGK